MSTAFLSQTWYRVAPLKPMLKPGLEIALHSYLGKPWFVIRDPVGGTVHRFTAQTYAIIGAMDGATALDAIWRDALDRLASDAPSQDDVLQLVIKLYQADLLLVDIAPLAEELVERMGKKRSKKRARFWKNPLSVPLPLFDPDRLLETLAPLARGRAGVACAILWCLLVGAAALILPATWVDLRAGGIEQFLALQNLVLVAAVYPVVKLIHELAHGLMVKRYGGECHEIGLMFLVFFPVPYVDASAAAAFPSKTARALVGAAGILAEIGIAAAALFLWRAAEPGLLRDAAYNAMLISGFSTLMVNGNPLLKFDGYYVFSDLIEMPNLASRSSTWWGHRARRLLGAPDPSERPVTRSEARVFALYAPLAFAYRLIIMVSIALFVAGTYFVVGVLLAGWSAFQGLILPVYKALKPLVTDRRLIERRGRVLTYSGLSGLALALLLFALPLPLRLVLDGVVWLPDESYVRSTTSGTVVSVDALPGQIMSEGEPILTLDNPGLRARLASSLARVSEAQSMVRTALVNNREDLPVAEQSLTNAEAELAELQQKVDGLTVRAGSDGRLSLDQPEDLPGRYLEQGDSVGHVLPAQAGLIRAVAPEYQAELLQRGQRRALLRLQTAPEVTYETALIRIFPAAGRRLPSPALAAANGGSIVTDPAEQDGMTALDPFLILDLSAPQLSLARGATAPFGGRALVRLDLGVEPLAYRIGRGLRRVFLRHFGGDG